MALLVVYNIVTVIIVQKITITSQRTTSSAIWHQLGGYSFSANKKISGDNDKNLPLRKDSHSTKKKKHCGLTESNMTDYVLLG